MIERSKINYYLSMFLAIGCLAGAGTSCTRTNISDVTIVNDTPESIEKCSIKVIDTTVVFNNLKAGDKASATFVVSTDSHYTVTVTFAGGRKLEKDVGYVTVGYDYTDRILIRPDEIVLSNKNPPG